MSKRDPPFLTRLWFRAIVNSCGMSSDSGRIVARIYRDSRAAIPAPSRASAFRRPSASISSISVSSRLTTAGSISGRCAGRGAAGRGTCLTSTRPMQAYPSRRLTASITPAEAIWRSRAKAPGQATTRVARSTAFPRGRRGMASFRRSAASASSGRRGQRISTGHVQRASLGPTISAQPMRTAAEAIPRSLRTGATASGTSVPRAIMPRRRVGEADCGFSAISESLALKDSFATRPAW